MKGSLQFEGPNTAGSDGYGAGFGIIAEPTAREVDLTGILYLIVYISLEFSYHHCLEQAQIREIELKTL